MIDRRTGHQECYNRYKVYPHQTNNNSLNIEQDYKILHAKDASPYHKQQVINKYAQTHISAVIETYDMITINPYDKLYSINEEKWYVVETVDEETENNSQMRSRRPITKRTIAISTNE